MGRKDECDEWTYYKNKINCSYLVCKKCQGHIWNFKNAEWKCHNKTEDGMCMSTKWVELCSPKTSMAIIITSGNTVEQQVPNGIVQELTSGATRSNMYTAGTPTQSATKVNYGYGDAATPNGNVSIVTMKSNV